MFTFQYGVNTYANEATSKLKSSAKLKSEQQMAQQILMQQNHLKEQKNNYDLYAKEQQRQQLQEELEIIKSQINTARVVKTYKVPELLKKQQQLESQLSTLEKEIKKI